MCVAHLSLLSNLDLLDGHNLACLHSIEQAAAGGNALQQQGVFQA
jgi:hypothetical protein